MAILVNCRCGHQYYTPDDPVGEPRPCPVCGHDSAAAAQSHKRRIDCGLLIGGAMICLALGASPAMVYVLLGPGPAVASSTWPTTPGVVENHEFTTSLKGVRPILGVTPAYRGFRVKYRYEVGGVEYANDRRSYSGDPAEGLRDTAEGRRELNERYPLGQACTVHYNPNNPAESCLEPGGGTTEIAVGWVLSAFFLSLGLLQLVVVIRKVKTRPKARCA